MKIACLVFVNGIVLINLIGGLRQAWKLCRMKIGTCRGVITSSGCGERGEWHGGSNQLRMYAPEVEYAYEVAGQAMKGSTISIFTVRSSDPSGTAKQLRLYPVGAEVDVFFNSEQPEQSYLINPKKHAWTSLGMVAVFVGFGCLMNLMIFRWVK